MKFTAILALASAALAAPANQAAAAPQAANAAQSWCGRPGSYSCTPSGRGWQVCNTSYQWTYAGACGSGQVCKYWPASQSPYCVPPWYQFS